MNFVVVLFYIFLQQPLTSDVFSLFSQISNFYKRKKNGVGFFLVFGGWVFFFFFFVVVLFCCWFGLGFFSFVLLKIGKSR